MNATKLLKGASKKVQLSQAAAAQSRSLSALPDFQVIGKQRWAAGQIAAFNQWIATHRAANDISFATWIEVATLLGQAETLHDACEIELSRRGVK